jgi:hypothetical protein
VGGLILVAAVVVVGAVQFSTVLMPQEVTVPTQKSLPTVVPPVVQEQVQPVSVAGVVHEQVQPTAIPTPTAEPQPTVVPTALPTALPTAVPTLSVPRPQLAFTAGQTAALAWPTDPGSTAWLAADGYHLFARQSQNFVAVGLLSAQLSDVVVSASFHKTGGPAGGGYGIILRDQGPGPRDGLSQAGRYYVVEVGDRGEAGIWRREQDHWIDVQPWSASPAVHAGNADNELVVKAVGDQLTLRVNGVDVVSKSDAALNIGGVGVFVGGDQNQAVLTRLTVESAN